MNEKDKEIAKLGKALSSREGNKIKETTQARPGNSFRFYKNLKIQSTIFLQGQSVSQQSVYVCQKP